MNVALVRDTSKNRANLELIARLGSGGTLTGPEKKNGARLRPEKLRQKTVSASQNSDEGCDLGDSCGTCVALHETEVQPVTR